MDDGTYSTYAGLPPSQGPPVSDDGRTGPLLSDTLSYPYRAQVNAETYTTGLFSSLQSGPIQGMGEARMPYYGHPLLPSTLPGHQGVPHAWTEGTAYARVSEVDAIYNSGQHSVSMSASLDQSHLYAHGDTGPNFSASSIPRIPSTSTVGKYEEGTSRNQPIQSPQTPKKRATASSRSSGRSSGVREAPKQSYACAVCGEEYAQMQGFLRHYRTKHHPSSCLFCDFQYGRPEHYRNHLTKRHELDLTVVDGILGKSAGSRRRTTIIGRDLPQDVSPPVIKHHRTTQPKPRQRRLTPPLSSVAKVTHVPSVFSPTEALARPVNNVVDHVVINAPGRIHSCQSLAQPSDGTYPHTHPA